MTLAECTPGKRVRYVGVYYSPFRGIIKGTRIDVTGHPVEVLRGLGWICLCSPAELEPMEAANGQS